MNPYTLYHFRVHFVLKPNAVGHKPDLTHTTPLGTLEGILNGFRGLGV